MQNVFITGATGNIGSRLVKDFLENNETTVHLLVRGDSKEHAQQRVKDILDFWEVEESKRSRVYTYYGSIAAPDFDLEQDDVDNLKKNITHVIHSAGSVRHDMSVEDARKQIYEASKNVYEFFKDGETFKRFGFVSTLEIVGTYNDIIYEEFLTEYRREFLNTYQSTKAEFESFLEKEVEKGADIHVYRPSMVIGDTEKGKILNFQSFYLMIRKLILYPPARFVPPGAPLDVVPVNVLSKGIASFVTNEKLTTQRVFNFCPGLQRFSFNEFASMIKNFVFLDEFKEHFIKRKPKFPFYIPVWVYDILLRFVSLFVSKDSKEISIQKNFIAFLYLDPKMESLKTKKCLKEAGIEYPRLDSYLKNILNYYFKTKLNKKN